MIQGLSTRSSRWAVCFWLLLWSALLGGCATDAPVAGPEQPSASSSAGQSAGNPGLIDKPASSSSSTTVIYPARAIVTMAKAQPLAEAVAISRGRIVGVDTLESLAEAFPDARLDRRFRNRVIVPGLIDPHMHVMLGAMLYAQPFAAPWPMAAAQGSSPGYPSRDAFLSRLEQIIAEAPADGSPVISYGYHDLIHGELDRADLDALSPERPLVLWHYSAHDFYLNSAALALIGATPEWANRFTGVDIDSTGQLTGRIYEDAVQQVFDQLRAQLFDPAALKAGLNRYFGVLRRAGVTSTADLAWGVFDFEQEARLIEQGWDPKRSGFRLYLVPEFRALNRAYAELAPTTVQGWAAGERPAPAPVLPRVKFFADGAYYSQTMRISPPGYLSGQSAGTQGLWVLQPEALVPVIKPYADQGLAVHVHANGDAAQTATLDALATLRDNGFTGDFVIEHGALFSPAQRQRVAELDAMVSVASHYVHYLADDYREPLGPTRSQWISPVGGLTRAGAVVALHSDAPLAPPIPLVAAARQVTRITRNGSLYATGQALSLYEALEAVTLDAARVLGLDTEFGSIEIGKRADFTILDRNPLQTPAERWPAINVWGVMLDGKPRRLPEIEGP